MTPIRLGAVAYLNARPLTFGLDRRTDLFSLRYDPPSRCAVLLHENQIDVGMIPAIEYCRGPEYHVVPRTGIISEGPVASVALFTNVPVERIRTIAADTSSRTSNALLRILCADRFGISPEVTAMAPRVDEMLAAADAALIIGDPALFLDPAGKGVEKVDLGAQWTDMTGLPFVWAFWAGRPGVLTPEAVLTLEQARDAGIANSDAIASGYAGEDRAALGQAYLRDNIQYVMGDREIAGVRRYYELAAKHGLIAESRPVGFYTSK